MDIMAISVFDKFKLGIGPSSSHTVGPMKAGAAFVRELELQSILKQTSRIEICLYGSLSSTGVGHNTDIAVLMGLMGDLPATVDLDAMPSRLEALRITKRLLLNGNHSIVFAQERDLLFKDEKLPYHPNGMSIAAFESNDILFQETYYSVGGGFIVSSAQAASCVIDNDSTPLPFDFFSANQLLGLCEQHRMSISQLMLENEKCWRTEKAIRTGILSLWKAMQDCVSRGLQSEGVLPGGLNVRRRAHRLHASLTAAIQPNVISTTMSAMEWVNLYALAVNEENAGGGRIVTAPTNGAAGVLPAVLHYYMQFASEPSDDDVVRFFLAAAAVGILFKKNASISVAEVGCQGEVGSACAMAAAGLAEILGASPEQVENAAEIGLEHNLGLTCDPVGGLVQIPCIERNAIAAVKAINAAQISLRDDGAHFISLDQAIRTLRETGADMHDKYKETSLGGLAVSFIEC
jgi:L-serine dehydratase